MSASPSTNIVVDPWYEVRDRFTGRNYRTEGIQYAINFARSSTQDYVLLKLFVECTSSVDVTDMTMVDDMCKIIINASKGTQFENEAIALSCAKHCGVVSLNMLKVAAKTSAFAQVLLSENMNFDLDTRTMYAKAAAEQGDRDGFASLSRCYIYLRNEPLQKQTLFKAASLGHVDSMRSMCAMQESNTREHWYWAGQAALGGFLVIFSKILDFYSVSSVEKFHIDALYEIGRVFTLIPRTNYKGRDRFITFYNDQLASARAAVDAWTVIARRFGVVKDMRRMVGELIWKAKSEANYVTARIKF